MSDKESGRLADRAGYEVSLDDDRAISLELLSAVTTLIPDASVIADGQGRIVSANHQAETLFGYPPGSLTGSLVEVLVPERVRRRHRGHREGFFAEAQNRPMGAGLELTGRRRDGTEFPIDISLAPITSGGQQLVIAAIRDVTELRRASEVQAELAAIVRSSFDAIISTSLDGRISNWNPAAELLLGYPSSEILGEHVSALMPDESLPVLEELLEAAMENRYREAILTLWRHRDGRLVDASVSIAPLKNQTGIFLGFCYVIRDNTERKKSEDELRRLFKEEELLQRQHAMTSEIRLALLSDIALDDALALICRRAAEFVDAAVAVICVRGPDGIRIVSGFGLDDQMLGRVLAPGASFAEKVIEEGTALELERRSDQSSVEVPASLPDGPTFGVPIAVGGLVTGSLTFVRPPDSPAFDTHVRIFAEALSAQAALAFEIDRAQRGRAQMMLLHDRERIARDLHDNVVQRIFAAGLSLQVSLPLISEDKALERIASAVDGLNETIGLIRNTIFSLSTSSGENRLFRAQINEVISEATAALGFAPRVEFTGLADEDVPDDVAPHVISCLREALSNVARHAQATAASVRLHITRDSLELNVVDDGVGFKVTPRSSGLNNMGERARLLGGRFEISAGEAAGTRLFWMVPIARGSES